MSKKKNNVKGGKRGTPIGFQLEEPEERKANKNDSVTKIHYPLNAVKIQPVEHPNKTKQSKTGENSSKNHTEIQTKPVFQWIDTGTCLSMVKYSEIFTKFIVN